MFIRVYAKYREIPTIVMVSVLGLIMAFIAYWRMVLKQFSEWKALVGLPPESELAF